MHPSIGTQLSGAFLDVQGFSHKSRSVFEPFHKQFPNKPMAATECCSCMSQRGVDEDVCPHPKDGGCTDGPKVVPGTFYNNNIGKCTADQVIASDGLDYVAGTYARSDLASHCHVSRPLSCSEYALTSSRLPI